MYVVWELGAQYICMLSSRYAFRWPITCANMNAHNQFSAFVHKFYDVCVCRGNGITWHNCGRFLCRFSSIPIQSIRVHQVFSSHSIILNGTKIWRSIQKCTLIRRDDWRNWTVKQRKTQINQFASTEEKKDAARAWKHFSAFVNTHSTFAIEWTSHELRLVSSDAICWHWWN